MDCWTGELRRYKYADCSNGQSNAWSNAWVDTGIQAGWETKTEDTRKRRADTLTQTQASTHTLRCKAGRHADTQTRRLTGRQAIRGSQALSQAVR